MRCVENQWDFSCSGVTGVTMQNCMESSRVLFCYIFIVNCRVLFCYIFIVNCFVWIKHCSQSIVWAVHEWLRHFTKHLISTRAQRKNESYFDILPGLLDAIFVFNFKLFLMIYVMVISLTFWHYILNLCKCHQIRKLINVANYGLWSGVRSSFVTFLHFLTII